MQTLKESLLAQLDAALAAHDALAQAQGPNRTAALNAFAYSAVAAIERTTGRDSSRSHQAREIAKSFAAHNAMPVQMYPLANPDALRGIVQSVRSDLDNGFLDDVRALIHAEVFADLLEQADYLLSEGYKDPAAVTCGCALENHLRNLCAKSRIDTRDADDKPKKASRLNDELAKAGAYSALEQKSVTAWLAVRNSAAHGQYGDYDAGQVKNMIAGVGDFIARHPA